VPYKVVKFQDTPNPNAVKCVLDKSPGNVPRSYLNAGAAASDPLGLALFAIPGVTSLLINDGWITVNKSSDAPWGKVRAAIERVLCEAE